MDSSISGQSHNAALVPTRNEILSELSQLEMQSLSRGLEEHAVGDQEVRPAYKGIVEFVNAGISLRLKQCVTIGSLKLGVINDYTV